MDNVKVYEAHDFELETAQFSPRQPYVIEERLPTDVEAECQSETDGSERSGGSEQRGRRATCPLTPPLSSGSSRRVNLPSAKLPTPPRDHSAPLCFAVLRLLLRSWWLLLLLCSYLFCVNSFWLLCPKHPRLCYRIYLCRAVYYWLRCAVISCSVTFLILSKLLYFTHRVVDSKFRGLVGTSLLDWERSGGLCTVQWRAVFAEGAQSLFWVSSTSSETSRQATNGYGAKHILSISIDHRCPARWSAAAAWPGFGDSIVIAAATGRCRCLLTSDSVHSRHSSSNFQLTTHTHRNIRSVCWWRQVYVRTVDCTQHSSMRYEKLCDSRVALQITSTQHMLRQTRTVYIIHVTAVFNQSVNQSVVFRVV